MILIFGYHPVTREIGPVEERTCPQCEQRRFWLLKKSSYCISLFFIPLVPTKTEKFTCCPDCGYHESLADSEFEKQRDLALLQKKALEKNWSEKEYQKQLRRLRKSL